MPGAYSDQVFDLVVVDAKTTFLVEECVVVAEEKGMGLLLDVVDVGCLVAQIF